MFELSFTEAEKAEMYENDKIKCEIVVCDAEDARRY